MKKIEKIQAGDEAGIDSKGEAALSEVRPDDPATDLATENAELRAALRQNAARDQLSQALVAAGARTPGLLCDAASTDLQLADDGSIVNAAALVERLKTQYPEQFRGPLPASIDAGAGRSTPAPLTKAALAKMSPAEITRLDWAAVRRVLSEK